MKRIFYVYLVCFIFAFSSAVHAQESPKPLIDAEAGKSSAEKETIPADFKSDGCTLWFDADYKDCCIQHDWAYSNWYKSGGWRGRLRADNHLFMCIADKGFLQKGMAPLMWLGVRLFGSPMFPAQKGNVIYNTSRKVIRFLHNSGSRRKSGLPRQKD